MAEMRRLRENQLQLNEPLPWDVYDGEGRLLLRKGYVLQRDAQIDRLVASGMFVNAAQFRISVEQSLPKRNFDPLAIWKETQGALGALIAAPPADGSLGKRVESLASNVLELCSKTPDLSIAAITLVENRRYALAHCLHTAVLCELVARRGDYDEDSRRSLICAALTQNIASLELQQILYNQRGPLTPAQRQAIDAHPMAGARMLQDSGITNQEWLRAVLEHHETLDGKGYPRKASNPSMLAQLIHAADVYSSMLSNRAHRKALLAPEAAKKLYMQMVNGQDNPVAGLLIKEFGMYPPGTFVRLANGEVCVSCLRNQENSNAPTVAVVINNKGLRQLDLVQRKTDGAAEFKIVAVLPRNNPLMNVSIDQIWQR